MDKRFDIIQERLESLSKDELQRLHDGIIAGKVCYDERNYDPETGRFCPLAIALGLDALENPTEEDITEELSQRFKPVNALKGVPGSFYHGDEQDRESDLLGLVIVISGKHG